LGDNLIHYVFVTNAVIYMVQMWMVNVQPL